MFVVMPPGLSGMAFSSLGVVSAVKGRTTAKAFHHAPRVGRSHTKPPVLHVSSSHPRGTFYDVDEVC